ncbi:MAG: flotillin, partial [Verrucomicrobia bacterium]
MNLIPMFAAVGDVLKGGWIIIAIIGIALVFFVGFLVVLSRYTKVGPNEVLVVSGRKHRYLDPD